MAPNTRSSNANQRPAASKKESQPVRESFATISRARDPYRIAPPRNTGYVSPRRVERILFENWGWD
jgi:hypothetical protein